VARTLGKEIVVMRNARAVLLGAMFVALVVGCGKKSPAIVPASGIIRLEGRPLKKVAVRFVPKTGQDPEYIAVGVTDESGRYTLTCNGKPGACAGEHHVLVTEAELPDLPKDERGHPQVAAYFQSLGGRPLPKQYSRVIDSPLIADVRPGRAEYDFDLTR
jgi:hypothetical protein